MSLPPQQRGKKLNALNKSLGCVLQALLDKKITVELNSEVEVRGTLVNLDAQMNLIFKDCTLKPVQVLTSVVIFVSFGVNLNKRYCAISESCTTH
jgi:small nuclear ribonucleoprotein (snRNP)-like protein